MPIKVNLNDPIQARLHENAITMKNSKIKIFRKKLNSVHPLIIPKKDNISGFRRSSIRIAPVKH